MRLLAASIASGGVIMMGSCGVSTENESQDAVFAAYKAAVNRDEGAFVAVVGDAALTDSYMNTRRRLQMTDFTPEGCELVGLSGPTVEEDMIVTKWSCDAIQGYNLAAKVRNGRITAAVVMGGGE